MNNFKQADKVIYCKFNDRGIPDTQKIVTIHKITNNIAWIEDEQDPIGFAFFNKKTGARICDLKLKTEAQNEFISTNDNKGKGFLRNLALHYRRSAAIQDLGTIAIDNIDRWSEKQRILIKELLESFGKYPDITVNTVPDRWHCPIELVGELLGDSISRAKLIIYKLYLATDFDRFENFTFKFKDRGFSRSQYEDYMKKWETITNHDNAALPSFWLDNFTKLEYCTTIDKILGACYQLNIENINNTED